jgi:hypothetical protein
MVWFVIPGYFSVELGFKAQVSVAMIPQVSFNSHGDSKLEFLHQCHGVRKRSVR